MKYIQKAILFTALAGAIAVFGGCGSTENQQPAAPEKTVTITDITGRQVEMPAVKKMAVVPLPWASVVYALDGNPIDWAPFIQGLCQLIKDTSWKKWTVTLVNWMPK